MGKLDDALALHSKVASELKMPRKTPTGIYPVDFYLDGGFAEGFIHVVAGKYKGGKTTMLMKTIANSQLKYPHKQQFWFDFEGTFDSHKAADHGIDLNNLIIVRPENGAEAADMISVLVDERCESIGIIAIDSLNRMTNPKEFEKDADEHTIAYNASIVTKLLSRVGSKLNNKSMRTEDKPTILAVSQIRSNIGFGFKDYKIPGARAL
jgi:RecA/RadA recombinase